MKLNLSCLLLAFGLSIALVSCNSQTSGDATSSKPQMQVAAYNEQEVHAVLDSFHAAAARADFDAYFGFMDTASVFMGTDATEYWNKQEFMDWSRPFFDNKKAWSFTALERHLYHDSGSQTVWFDELLQTQMKICRGSGVLTLRDGHWKIRQYVLSMTMPNEQIGKALQLKAGAEDSLMQKLQR
jgi:hypothetical protein